MYLVESGTVANNLINSLIEATNRGVTVKLLLDGFGCRGLSRDDKNRLNESGIDAQYYNPVRLGKWTENILRDHRKIILIDGETVFTGGLGFTDEFFRPDHPGKSWRETVISISGPVVADWQELFSFSWKRTTGVSLTLPRLKAPESTTGAQGRVTGANGLLPGEIKRSVNKRINTAEFRVWIATAYFLPSWKLRRSLRKAARRGVDVKLLLPGHLTDHPGVRRAGQRFFTRLLRAGVKIFEYQPKMHHQKVILVDQWASIGSSNIDRWGFFWNLEANQEVDDTDFAGKLETMLEEDFHQCAQCEFESWIKRPHGQRLLEWFWGLVDVWLNAIGRSRRHH